MTRQQPSSSCSVLCKLSGISFKPICTCSRVQTDNIVPRPGGAQPGTSSLELVLLLPTSTCGIEATHHAHCHGHDGGQQRFLGSRGSSEFCPIRSCLRAGAGFMPKNVPHLDSATPGTSRSVLVLHLPIRSRSFRPARHAHHLEHAGGFRDRRLSSQLNCVRHGAF
jgi:hypothetical protein